ELPNSLQKKIQNCSFFAINDVLNPLCGPLGAANIYGPQKGGSEETILAMDGSFEAFVCRFNFPYPCDISLEGGGAAGGTAYGLKVFLNAQFVNGFDFLSSIASLNDLLITQNYDYVISGEGSLDSTSFQGKLLGRLVDLTEKHQLPLLLVCGQCHFDASALTNTHIVELLDEETPIAQCIAQPFALIENKVYHFFKFLL
ncbi:MAG: glycerate kinase, partial [Flavobacteriaceae bacterium]